MTQKIIEEEKYVSREIHLNESDLLGDYIYIYIMFNQQDNTSGDKKKKL